MIFRQWIRKREKRGWEKWEREYVRLRKGEILGMNLGKIGEREWEKERNKEGERRRKVIQIYWITWSHSDKMLLNSLSESGNHNRGVPINCRYSTPPLSLFSNLVFSLILSPFLSHSLSLYLSLYFNLKPQKYCEWIKSKKKLMQICIISVPMDNGDKNIIYMDYDGFVPDYDPRPTKSNFMGR